jgi:hypothetical protein
MKYICTICFFSINLIKHKNDLIELQALIYSWKEGVDTALRLQFMQTNFMFVVLVFQHTATISFKKRYCNISLLYLYTSVSSSGTIKFLVPKQRHNETVNAE